MQSRHMPRVSVAPSVHEGVAAENDCMKGARVRIAGAPVRVGEKDMQILFGLPGV